MTAGKLLILPDHSHADAKQTHVELVRRVDGGKPNLRSERSKSSAQSLEQKGGR